MKEFEEKIEKLGGIESMISENSCSVKKNVFTNGIPETLDLFIQQFGAFAFQKSVLFRTKVEIPIRGDNNEVSIDNFYGLSEESLALISDIVPKDYLPICDGEAGDVILIALNKNEYGKVFYWHHEGFENKNLYLIAENFSEFIFNLEEDNLSSDISIKDVTISKVSAKFLERLKRSGKL